MKKLEFAKLKNLILCVFVLCITIMLTGCANVDYSRFVYPTGEITDRLVVELDVKKIHDAGVNVSVLVQNIKQDLENYYIQPIIDFKNEYMHEEHTYEQKQYVNNGILHNVEVVGNYRIAAEVTFKSISLFNLYYGNDSDNLEGDSDGQIEFRQGTFVNRYVQSSQNAFAVLKTDAIKQLVEKYKMLTSNQFTWDDVTLTQVYASPDTDIKSNADVTEVSQGIKMHQWEIDPNNLDFNLEFYTVTPRTGPWYILALFITLLVTFIIYNNIRSHKYKDEKKKNQQTPTTPKK